MWLTTFGGVLLNDEEILARMTSDLKDAGVEYPQRLARQFLAHITRQRQPKAQVWAPGDCIPDDTLTVDDIDGDRWDRDTPENPWRMRRADPLDPPSWWNLPTAMLLARHGPVTEVQPITQADTDSLLEEPRRLVPTPLETGGCNPKGGRTVYYLRREDGAIKIGFSADLNKRMATLAKEFGPLELLATEPGGYAAELKRHRQFHRFRVTIHQEWFRPAPELLEHIENLTKRRPGTRRIIVVPDPEQPSDRNPSDPTPGLERPDPDSEPRAVLREVSTPTEAPRRRRRSGR